MAARILFFESDPQFARDVKSKLEARGATVDSVTDGNEGLARAVADRPDLILLTIELPQMNGFLVCKRLKKNAETQSIPVIILSSEATEEIFEQHRKLRTRAEDYVRKPVSPADLVERVGSMVQLTATAEVLDLSEVEIALDEVEEVPENVDNEIEEFAESAFDALMMDDDQVESTAVAEIPAEIQEAIAASNAAKSKTTPPPAADLPPPADLETVAPSASPSPEKPKGPPEPLRRPEREQRDIAQAMPSPELPGPPAGSIEAVASKSALSESSAPTPVPEAPTDHRDELEAKDVNDAEDAREEAAALRRKLADADRAARRASSNVERLEREVSELRAQLAKAGTGGGGISSRDFLDLREKMNSKDKEILDLRDQVSARDKQMLDLRDSILRFERQRADDRDATLVVERAKAALEDEKVALLGDKEALERELELLKGKIDRREAAIVKLEKKLEARDADVLLAQTDRDEKVAEAEKRCEEAVAAAEAERDAKVAEAQRLHKEEVASKSAEHAAALEAAKAAAETAQSAALEAAEAEKAEALAQLRAELERAKREAVQAVEAEKTSALERVEVEKSRALEESEALKAAELAALANEHQQAMNAQREEQSKELAILGRKMAETETRLGEAEERIGDLSKERDDLNAALEASRAEIRGANEDLEARVREIGALEAVKSELESRLHALEQAGREVEARLSEAERKMKGDAELLTRARRAFAIGLSLLEDQENGAGAGANAE